MAENSFFVVGRLTSDPELKFTKEGRALCRFSLAVDHRPNPQTGEKKTSYADFIAWGELGEHIAESLGKGDRALVAAAFHQDTYETREGEKRTTVRFQVEEAGPALRFATAKVTNVSNNNRGGQADGPPRGSGGQSRPPQRQQAQSSRYEDEEPF